jgi:hypothetical protein
VASYRFVDRWFVPGPVDEVYERVGDTLSYPSWWGDVFVSVDGDGGPPRPGRHVKIVSRGYLPYLLRWEAEVTEADPPRGFVFTMVGDFVGNGSWSFEPGEGGTNATFDFRPRVEKPLVKYLTPVLRPPFRSNHGWAMRRGERGTRTLFAPAD